jgi:hypothetical protein
MNHRRKLAIAALVTTAFVAACDQIDPVSPSKSSQVGKTSSHDTSTVDPPQSGPNAPPSNSPPPPDSAASAYHGTVALTGRTLVLRHAAAGSTGDTLLYQPVAGTTVTVADNATGATAATAVTGADGSFAVSVPAGTYRISGHPPAGLGASDGSILVFAGQAAVNVWLYLPSTP